MSILLNALFYFGGLGFRKTGVGFSMNMEDLGSGIWAMGYGLWDSVFYTFAALCREVSDI